MELNLQITTDLASLPAAIEFNYPELKASMEKYLERFDGLVVTEDQIKQAKDDRAEINKVVEAISRARIDTKKRWLAPFESFETKAKELESLGKRAAQGIDEQLAEFERRRVEEKRKTLSDLFANMLAEAFGADMDMPERKTAHWREYFAAQTNPKQPGNWLNKGVSESKAALQMNAEIQRCKSALSSLETIYAEEDAEVRITARFALCRRFDMEDAAHAVREFKANREAAERVRAEEERKRREAEEAKQAAMERAKEELAAKRSNPPPKEEPPAAPPPPPPEQPKVTEQAKEKTYSYTIRIVGLASALRRVREAIMANGVTYERLSYEEVKEQA